MSITRHADPDGFLAAAVPLIAGNPATRAFLVMLADAWRRNPAEHADGYAATYAHAGEHGIAICGRHRSVMLENSTPAAARAFADDMPDAMRDVRSVHGELAACQAFAARWCERFGGTYREGMHLRHHRLTAVQPVPTPGGAMRTATPRDLEWLTARSLAFAAEARIPDPPETIVESVHKRLAAGRYRIWEDDRPLALAAYSAAGREAARIAPVYTLPDARRRGYATALTAALARELLDGGCHELFLMTDVANPTSNAIYARIGFRPVSDVRRFDFVRLAEAATAAAAPA